MTKRKKIGDIYEIRTNKGLAYFQYIYEYTKSPKWGSLIRVLEGFYEIRPSLEELQKIVDNPHRFQTFCFLQHAIEEGRVKKLETLKVPKIAKKFPIFKGTNSNPKRNPLDKIWWLWDGEKEWRVGKLSMEEQMKYPLDGVCNITALIGSIETGSSLGNTLC